MNGAKYALPQPVRRTCTLFRVLAGHEALGLAPTEIAKALDVPASWVSVNLPALEAETGFVERVPDTNRWRLGAPFVRLAFTVAAEINAARRRLDDIEQRYGIRP